MISRVPNARGPTGAAGVAMLRRAAGERAGGTHLVAAPLYHSGPNTYCEGAVLLGATSCSRTVSTPRSGSRTRAPSGGRAPDSRST